jgi:hypothetical protein
MVIARASLLRKVEKRRFWNIKIDSTKYKGKLMVCPANSSYSFRATALIFCMMFIHIMEVDLFIISYGQAGASFVSCRHTLF